MMTAGDLRDLVQGAWWPRSTQLTTELPLLLAALSSQLGTIDRIVYDENASTTDDPLAIGMQTAEDRSFALMAHQRWESDGGALRRPEHQPAGSVTPARGQEVRSAK